MVFKPYAISPKDKICPIEEPTKKTWTPLSAHNCSFSTEIFREVMLNFIRRPNLNSNHLFRADILLDSSYEAISSSVSDIQIRVTHFSGFTLKSIMVRTLIPRNILVDKPMDQTCLLYEKGISSDEITSLVVYRSHISSATEMPFYHPAVDGIGFLHSYNPATKKGTVSIHYLFFDSHPRSEALDRTAHHLLALLYKHGEGLHSGYVKKAQHDSILPQAKVQNTYARLKAKYARDLCQNWVEKTDPGKHVFEDLNIAAYLIELWTEMYPAGTESPKFVDIGCGNGLLVHILVEEGYEGWGFDARRRKSWSSWSEKAQGNLKELVLIPFHAQNNGIQDDGIHDGRFPNGTFIISNHADELTPWTPILATLSESPFITIPCCSHAFSGSRFRAAPPKGLPGASAYASLVAWVADLAVECGWQVEKDVLRIPSTRNAALIGRKRTKPYEDIDIEELITRYGGCAGWEENALKLVDSAARGH